MTPVAVGDRIYVTFPDDTDAGGIVTAVAHDDARGPRVTIRERRNEHLTFRASDGTITLIDRP